MPERMSPARLEGIETADNWRENSKVMTSTGSTRSCPASTLDLRLREPQIALGALAGLIADPVDRVDPEVFRPDQSQPLARWCRRVRSADSQSAIVGAGSVSWGVGDTQAGLLKGLRHCRPHRELPGRRLRRLRNHPEPRPGRPRAMSPQLLDLGSVLRCDHWVGGGF